MKYEYATLSYTINERWSSKKQQAEIAQFNHTLTQWGQQGWRLVTQQDLPLHGRWTGKVNETIYLYIFERQTA